MKHSMHLGLALLLGVVGALPWGVGPASAQSTLSPTLVSKAKAFKDVDDKYRLALCNGSQSDRDQSKGARDYVQNDLQQQIADEVAASPLVQKALDAAAAAGDAAQKVAAAPGASDQEKAAAADRFQQAKSELKDVAAREKIFVEAELGKDYGVTFAALDACPGKPTVAAHDAAPAASAKPKAKVPEKKQVAQQRAAAPKSAGSTTGGNAQAPTPSVNIGLGGGGGSISFGGITISH
ncbi:MAG TPA: hypothetical protein VKW08_03100 [Xanthobacteraceae bacterium]|nr:hypothetical protein [Xanthobacteraceae bacterium]